MAQETDDPVKIEVYTRFVNNRKTNESAAYQAAKEYLSRNQQQRNDFKFNYVMYYVRLRYVEGS